MGRRRRAHSCLAMLKAANRRLPDAHAGSVIEIGGGADRVSMQYRSIQNRAAGNSARSMKRSIRG